MQWKHEKNRNEFKFTLSQLAFAIVLLFIVLTSINIGWF